MFKTKMTIGLLLMLFYVNSAQALPITGSLSFVANGTFTEDGSGDLNGFDFESPGGGLPLITLKTGDIEDMLALGGVLGTGIVLSDFSLDSIPTGGVLEWTIASVKVASGVTADLIFKILSGGEQDSGLPDDIGGTGIFSLINATGAFLSTDTWESQVGTWSISTASLASGVVVTITGQNVPAPATIGLLGLGLLGLGAIRRRRSA